MQVQIQNQRGQGLIEYIILVALIAVASIGFIKIFQRNLNVQLANVANSISGKATSPHEGREIKGRIEAKDFGSFMKGATSGEKE